MQVLDSVSYLVRQIISDNAILAEHPAIAGHPATEVLVYSSGLGRGASVGEWLETDASNRMEHEVNTAEFRRMLARTDPEVVAACEDAIHLIIRELEEELDPQIHITFTEHVSELVEKARRQEPVINPILIQTEILYREEYQVSKQVITCLEQRLSLRIAEGEIGFIALYIHGARRGESAPYSARYAVLANEVTQFLERCFCREVDKDTLDYMRLVTHLRLAIERVATGNTIKNLLLEQIQEEYQEAYNIAVEAAQILERDLDRRFPEDEIAFFALYVERLRDP